MKKTYRNIRNDFAHEIFLKTKYNCKNCQAKLGYTDSTSFCKQIGRLIAVIFGILIKNRSTNLTYFSIIFPANVITTSA